MPWHTSARIIFLATTSIVFSLAAGDTINEAADGNKLQQQQLAFLGYTQSTFQFVNRQLAHFMDDYERLKRAERRRLAVTEIVVGADGAQSVYSEEGSQHRRLNLMDLAQLDEIIANGGSMQEAAKQEKSRRALGGQDAVDDDEAFNARALLDFTQFSFNYINQQMATFMDVDQRDERRRMQVLYSMSFLDTLKKMHMNGAYAFVGATFATRADPANGDKPVKIGFFALHGLNEDSPPRFNGGYVPTHFWNYNADSGYEPVSHFNEKHKPTEAVVDCQKPTECEKPTGGPCPVVCTAVEGRWSHLGHSPHKVENANGEVWEFTHGGTLTPAS